MLNEMRNVTFKTFFFPSVQLFLRLKVGNIYANMQMHVWMPCMYGLWKIVHCTSSPYKKGIK